MIAGVVCLAAAVAPTVSFAQTTPTLAIGHPSRHHHHRRHRRSLPANPSFCAVTATVANVQATAESVETMRQAVLCLIDQQRRAHGLPNLVLSTRLDSSAQEWTLAMVTSDDYAHGNFLGRVDGVGYRPQLVGENIMTNSPTPAAVVNAWMASPDHCKNILNPSFRDVGVGETPAAVGYGGPATWTMDLGLSMDQTPLSSNWAPARGCPY